jgi:hypothetical protein
MRALSAITGCMVICGNLNRTRNLLAAIRTEMRSCHPSVQNETRESDFLPLASNPNRRQKEAPTEARAACQPYSERRLSMRKCPLFALLVRIRLPSNAGVTTVARLETMLGEAAIAFLVLTAEDEQKDGKVQARMNVIHEVGLFQGRLGFSRAIRHAGGRVRGILEHRRAGAITVPKRRYQKRDSMIFSCCSSAKGSSTLHSWWVKGCSSDLVMFSRARNKMERIRHDMVGVKAAARNGRLYPCEPASQDGTLRVTSIALFNQGCFRVVINRGNNTPIRGSEGDMAEHFARLHVAEEPAFRIVGAVCGMHAISPHRNLPWAQQTALLGGFHSHLLRISVLGTGASVTLCLLPGTIELYCRASAFNSLTSVGENPEILCSVCVSSRLQKPNEAAARSRWGQQWGQQYLTYRR